MSLLLLFIVTHILKLKEFPKPARDQLCIELTTDIRLRSGEIATLRIENIDLERLHEQNTSLQNHKA